MFRVRKETPAILNFDWEGVLKQLQQCDPNSGDFYLIVTNKGQDDEYRTKFMTYQEALELVMLALEKKKLRIPLAL
jgi:hypothetical protein